MRHKRDREARQWRKVANDMRQAARRVEQIAHSLASEGTVHPGVSRTGRVVLRCSECNKVCYSDEKAALDAVAKIPDPMVA